MHDDIDGVQQALQVSFLDEWRAKIRHDEIADKQDAQIRQVNEHGVMGFTAFDGNELYAGSADPQFGAAVDGDIRLEAPHVVDVVPLAEELPAEEGRTTGGVGNLLGVVIPCVELQPRI